MCPVTQIPDVAQSTPTTVSSDTLLVPQEPSPALLRRTTLTAVPEQEYPNSVPSNLPNAITPEDYDDHIEQIRTNTLSRRSSLSSGLATPVPLTHRASHISIVSSAPSQSRWRSHTPRNSIFTMSSLLSRPPSYKRFDPIESDLPADAENEAHHLGGWKGLQTQFYGVYFAFWLVVLAFVGAVAVIVPGLPAIALLLWIPLVVYIGIAFHLFRQRRKERAAIEAAAPERERRESRVRELLHAMRLPDSYFFLIDNQKDHRHPVVTLLPPPPNYANDNNANVPQPPNNEIPPSPPPFYPNTSQEDEDYVRINLHGLLDAEHRDEQRQNRV
ncbi:hypothetical protein INT44_007684 [Umbelopsis vinacea]|uniref:Uncharacterized protein n=1 Tax=Umbelopsis vinacea TaxID=44442 RepID=A0A8H7PJR3_9FUNG|nr:hypothetical protein INT44_007684 [Umbelopsis vinacea]